MDAAPSMVHRSGDSLIIRSVVSGNQLYINDNENNKDDTTNLETSNAAVINDNNNLPILKHFNAENIEHTSNNAATSETGGISTSGDGNLSIPTEGLEEENLRKSSEKDEGLPQCKIKRNYSCSNCSFFTQNPRLHLIHLRDKHGEKINIYDCKLCLYASRHYQKLVRHMKMVHGSTEGLVDSGSGRKRSSNINKILKRQRKQFDGNHTSGDGSTTQQSVLLSNTSAIAIVPSQSPISTTYPLPLLKQALEMPLSADKKPFKCAICDFTTPIRVQLIEHEKNDHIKTRFFRCIKCNYVTHIKARYSKHVKYHSMPMIKCMMCDFRTPYKWNLDRHMKNHGGAGPFKCSACNFTADIKQSLTVHEMNHHVPPVGHVTSLVRRKLKVGGTDLGEEANVDSGSERHELWPANFSMLPAQSEETLDSNENSNMSNSYRTPTPNDLESVKSKSEPETDTFSEIGSIEPPPSKKQKLPIPNLIPINFNNFNNNNNNIINHIINKPDIDVGDDDDDDNNSVLNLSIKKVDNENQQEKLDMARKNLSNFSKTSVGPNKSSRPSFYDKLKYVTEFADPNNLICRCGHVSKCLTESITHKKTCDGRMDGYDRDHILNITTNKGSTRCQYCRHRCKSSVDLMNHIQKCSEAPHNSEGSSKLVIDEDDNLSMDEDESESIDENQNEPHPMENVVFVWNKIRENNEKMEFDKHDEKHDDDDIKTESADNIDDDIVKESPTDINQYYAIETAPGYGEITKEVKHFDELKNFSLKRVFKCPQCPFWASTASRFHVHIVGHLNQKPFECSLCAYRSNWRWDITKHIRLKTIRDPNHEKAKVLMNDETGRRNYTKYNKYITLVKVTAENTDTKFLKSGDIMMNNDMMEHHSENDSKNTSASTSPMLATILSSNNNNSTGIISGNIGDGSVAINLTSENHSDNSNGGCNEDFMGRDAAHMVDKKKTTNFKCKKCNFRHPSRDIVLAHVKQHYRDAGIPIDDITTDTSNQATPPMDMSTHTQKSSLYNLLSLPESISYRPHTSTTADKIHDLTVTKITSDNQRISRPLQPSEPSITLTPTTPTVVTTAPRTTNDHGETDEASSGVSSVSGWRCPAPYRCGHCHQVSNWKHVIQRHCRLKHRGDIRIELFDKISLKNNKSAAFPNYQPININNTVGRHANHVPSNPISAINMWTSLNNINQNEIVKRELKSPHDENTLRDDSERDTSNTEEEEHFGFEDQSTQSSHGGDGLKSPIDGFKKYKCDECPYFTDSKYQFMYHESFHKPRDKSPYQCNYCSYNVSKRHLLSQHVRIHENADLIAHKKEIMFCQNCPARYTVDKDLQLHCKMHAKKFPYRCFLCSYTTRHESHLKNHLNVHSNAYNDKTKELEKNYKISHIHTKPNMKCINSSNQTPNSGDEFTPNQSFWIVTTDIEYSNNNSNSTNIETKMSFDSINQLNKVPLTIENRITNNNNNKFEKCPHCPFSTPRVDILKNHLQFHKCISGYERDYQCQHCDFSINDFSMFNTHNALHFTSLQNLLTRNSGLLSSSSSNNSNKSNIATLNGTSSNINNLFSDNNNVAFYTSFKNLEISLIKLISNNLNNNAINNSNSNNPISTTELVYKDDTDDEDHNNDDKVMDHNDEKNLSHHFMDMSGNGFLANGQKINNNASVSNKSSDEKKIILNISNASDIMG